MTIRQRDIYWAELNPTRGREQRGRRPVLVLSRNEINRLPLTITVMVGTGAEHLDPDDPFPTDVWVTAAECGLPKDTVFLGLHIRAVDPSRLEGYIGTLPAERMGDVWAAVRYVLGDER